MAGLKEFHSFVGKFVSLWQNGIEASLHVDSKAGEATVSLQVGLGHAQPLQEQQPLPKSRPSRLRRRQRRAEARKTAEEVAKSDAIDASAVAAVAVGAQYIHVVEETTEETETDSVIKDTIAVKVKVSNFSITDEAGKAQETENEANKRIPEEVIDEVCPKEEYSEAKSISTASQSATSTSSTSTRKPFLFDYNTLTYDNMSDPD